MCFVLLYGSLVMTGEVQPIINKTL